MGVPKFYRWISERYPCLSQVVKDYQIPEFDNFYLDMNGIIHNCSHPNDNDPSFRISEQKIFQDIFHYLEVLFRIVKPKKVMFMAIDGVAPRAKMNQQRGRRFRSAKDAEDLMRKAVSRGVDLPSEARFDSNCITPGTEFMSRLNDHLKYFINQKLSSDPSWQKVEIIFSGHEVPGEGEHKVMDYIRYQKSQENYDPNTRHCLYGLDADLIMLGLVTHEPHFSLLREEIVFGKNVKKATNPESITFHLLHLSILREYLDHEFASLKNTLPFPYDIESIIDDWVLMGYLVGNDFIPHLPEFHIKQEVLPFLYKTYTSILPSLGGYININGTLNLERFEKYLEAIAQFDMDGFADKIGGQRWFKGKQKEDRKKGRPVHKQQALDGSEDIGQSSETGGEEGGETLFLFGGLNDDSLQEDTKNIDKLKRDLNIPNMKSYFEDEDVDFKDNFEREMHEMKCKYYKDKFDLDVVNSNTVSEICKCYVVGVQWVLSYYYTGVPSWSWFYPYHYAPFVSDMKSVHSLSITFTRGKPFLPFEQLLAVLPPASRFLLPKTFQGLMVDDDSSILDFYPLHLETDLNGKQHEWEAVVLIPFIDESRLLKAMKPLSLSLTVEEVKRNAHGPCCVYTYDKDTPSSLYPSPWPTQFPDIHSKTRCELLSSDPYAVPRDSLVTGLSPKVKLDVHFPGFPTLKHLPHKPFLDCRSVRVFQSASRGQNMCLRVENNPLEKESLEAIAHKLIGQKCYTSWPYLVEARICGVANETLSYYDNPQNDSRRSGKFYKCPLNMGDADMWRRNVTDIKKNMIYRKGVELGEINVLVYAKELQGKRLILDKTGPQGVMILSKQWSRSLTAHPLKSLVFDIYECAPAYRDKTKTLEEVFEKESTCFLLTPDHYGTECEVVSVDSSRQKVCVKYNNRPEPDLSHALALYDRLKERYKPQRVVADELGIPPQAIGRIMSSFKCERGNRDNKKEREQFELGLKMKQGSRNLEMVGYTQKGEKGWFLSRAAIDILRHYTERFPTMFSYLTAHPDEDRYYETDFFPPNSPSTGSLNDVKEWMKSLVIRDMELTNCGSDTLNEMHIAEIDKAISVVKNKQSKVEQIKVHPSSLYMPSDVQRGILPDEYANHYVFDRVVNVAGNGTVPFGYRGTITGIMFNEQDNKNTLYEIIFDEEFLGGMPLRCTGDRGYRLPASCLMNVSYGKRWEQSMQQQDGRQHQQQKTKHHSQQKSYSQAVFTNEPQSTGSGRKTGSDYSYDSKRSGEYRRGREANVEKRSVKTGSSREGKPIRQQQQQGNEFDVMFQSMQNLSPPSTRDKESKDGVSKDSSTLPPELANAVKALKFITEQDKNVQQKDKGRTADTSKPQRSTKSYSSKHAVVHSGPKIMSKSDGSTNQQQKKTDPDQSTTVVDSPHTISLTVQELFQSTGGQKDTSGPPGLMNKDPYLTDSLKRDLGMFGAQKRHHQQAPPHGHAPRGPTPVPFRNQFPPPIYPNPTHIPPQPYLPFGTPMFYQPSLMMPPPHFLHHSAVMPGSFIRGPKPPPPNAQVALPTQNAILNPTAIAFTPLQVEIKQAKSKPSRGTEQEPDVQKENELHVVTSSKTNRQQQLGSSNQTNNVHQHESPVEKMESRAETNTDELKQLTASTVGLKNLINEKESKVEEVEPVAPTTIDAHPPVVVGDIVSSVLVPDDQT